MLHLNTKINRKQMISHAENWRGGGGGEVKRQSNLQYCEAAKDTSFSFKQNLKNFPKYKTLP